MVKKIKQSLTNFREKRKGGSSFRYKQGIYTPKNPDKYVGDVSKITYRSSWELSFNQFLDNNPNILQWSSEEIAIPYLKPTTGRIHRYFPDYWIKYKNKDGEELQEIIEIKPSSQVKRSRAKKPKQKLYEDIAFIINIAKWQQATIFCKKLGIKFRILTEHQLFK